MGLASLLSPLRIRRAPKACIDCAKCAKECPALLPVDVLPSVRSAECTGCYQCVAICPAEGALQMKAGVRRTVAPWVFAATLAVLFFGIAGYARYTGHWRTDLPAHTYSDLIEHAGEYPHP